MIRTHVKACENNFENKTSLRISSRGLVTEELKGLGEQKEKRVTWRRRRGKEEGKRDRGGEREEEEGIGEETEERK